jgi:hypothetical protein
MRWGRAVGVWLAIAVAMVVQGTAREALLRPSVGELLAHQISSVTGSGIILAALFLSFSWLGLDGSPKRQLQLGGFWLLLTIAFEFGFGHWVAGHSWSRLLADYDLASGRLWIVVLLTTFAGPRAVGWIRARRGH